MNQRKLLIAILALSALILLLPFFFRPGGNVGRSSAMPWEIEILADGKSRVLGITLEQSTLAEAAAQLGDTPRIAIIAPPGQAGSLEAYFEKLNLGGLGGKLWLSTQLDPKELLVMQQRALKSEPQESGNRRYTLAAEDQRRALNQVVRGLSFMPDARLDAQVVTARFGPPAERLKQEDAEHLLYAAKGLDVVLLARGKTALQYVAPDQFQQRIRGPLGKAP